MDKKRVTVMVASQKFTILTEEDEKYVIDIAAKIDAHITSLTMSNMSREKAAVLTALDFADDNEKIKREIGAIREQMKDYIEGLANLRAENEELRAQIERTQKSDTSEMDKATIAAMEKEIEGLKAQLALAKKQAEEQPAPAPVVEEAPLPEDAPAEEEEAPARAEREEELYVPAEPKIKPPKKPRHEHKHENPYRQQFMNRKGNDNKGYTPQRQYSLFDDEE